jgi:hypothetical protein
MKYPAVLILGVLPACIADPRPAAPPVSNGPDAAPSVPSDGQREATKLVFLFEERSSSGPPTSPYGPIVTMNVDGSNKRTVVKDGLSPSWTPDGRIIFVSERSGSPQIWTVNADGTGARQIGDLPPAMQPVMPQMAMNGLVAFTGHAKRQEVDGNADVWLMNQDGSNLRDIAIGMQPSLAISGTWIAYTFQTDEPYHRQIWRIDTDGSNKRQLTFLGDPEYPDANAPNISPDESTIAFFSGKESDRFVPGAPMQSIFTWGHRNVAVMPASGGTRRTLTPCQPVTNDAELDERTPTSGKCIAADNPAWSPDSRWLVFDTGFKGGTETWKVSTSGAEFMRFHPASRGVVRVPLRAAR